MQTEYDGTVTDTDDLKFKDFTLAGEAPVMRIAPDEFHCYPEIPLDVMMDVARFSQTKVEGLDRFTQLMELIAGIIVPEDYDKFIARTKRGTKEQPNPYPIGMRHIRDILPWVLEVYGMRPTQASSDSASGSDDAVTSSTEPVSAADSTS